MFNYSFENGIKLLSHHLYQKKWYLFQDTTFIIFESKNNYNPNSDSTFFNSVDLSTPIKLKL